MSNRRQREPRVLWAMAVVVAGLLAACSSSDDGPEVKVVDAETTTTKATTTTTEAPSPTEAAKGYFEAFTSGDVVKMEQMAALSVEGSPAWLYGVHQTNLTRIDGGNGSQKLTTEGDTYRVCAGTGSDESCSTYADFVADPSGKLQSFTIEGLALADLIVAGGPEVSASGLTVKISTAYQGIAGRLFLVLDVRNDTDQPVPSGASLYLTGDGRQVESEFSGLFGDIQPGATAQDYAAFPSVERGGTLIYSTYIDDYTTEVEIRVAVP